MNVPLLLTPGPLTTSEQTRAALNRDWGSRESDFIAITARIRDRLISIANVRATHVAVPLPGSGTFAVEAAIQTLVPRDGKLLVLVNGAYGRRIAMMANRLGLACDTMEFAEHEAISPGAVAAGLAGDPAITDVALVHCETTSGLLNPLRKIADVVRKGGRRLLVDAMSAFGAVPIDGRNAPFTALIASANKGLEGVPGVGFVIADRQHLVSCEGNAISLSLDLHDQWRGFERDGQWRFTPPVQVIAALSAALDQLETEGGVPARTLRYQANCDALIHGMRRHGFAPFLDPSVQAPVIVTFRIPDGGWFDFEMFYDVLQARGVVIYPGKLTTTPSFRIGCIGAIGPAEISRALDAVDAFMLAHGPAHAH